MSPGPQKFYKMILEIERACNGNLILENSSPASREVAYNWSVLVESGLEGTSSIP